MKNNIAIALVATAAGILAGFVTTGTSALADEPSGSGINVAQPCELRTDTNCSKWERWPAQFGPRVIRYSDEGRFCVVRFSEPHVVNYDRCERYWPFTNPVINPNLAP
jgi:hypothetical protein